MSADMLRGRASDEGRAAREGESRRRAFVASLSPEPGTSRVARRHSVDSTAEPKATRDEHEGAEQDAGIPSEAKSGAEAEGKLSPDRREDIAGSPPISTRRQSAARARERPAGESSASRTASVASLERRAGGDALAAAASQAASARQSPRAGGSSVRGGAPGDGAVHSEASEEEGARADEAGSAEVVCATRYSCGALCNRWGGTGSPAGRGGHDASRSRFP